MVRAHNLVPEPVWSKRYEPNNDFEKRLVRNGKRIFKFYLHSSPEGQLERFKQRLDDPPRHCKFSETDYSGRELWPDYIEAFEDAIEKEPHQARPVLCDPVQPQVVPQPGHLQDSCRHTGGHGLKLPPTPVDIAEIRRKYHTSAVGPAGQGKQSIEGVAQEVSTSQPKGASGHGTRKTAG